MTETCYSHKPCISLIPRGEIRLALSREDHLGFKLTFSSSIDDHTSKETTRKRLLSRMIEHKLTASLLLISLPLFP